MSFSNTKNRLYSVYDRFGRWLARRSHPIRRAVYSVFGMVFWIIYLLPSNQVRPTLVALTKHIGSSSPARLYGQYVRKLFLGIDRLERVRHGFGAEFDDKLVIPERERLEKLLEHKGFMLVMPHVHGSFAMARGLSQVYPVMSLVRNTRNEKRSAAQWELYEKVGCEVMDVRNEDPVTVARTMLRKLKSKTIVIGIVDRIEYPSRKSTGQSGDMLNVLAFGEEIDAPSWPARFALKSGAPIVPATVEQTDTELRLILGKTVVPSENLVTTTQEWMTEIETLCRTYPQEWAFWLDKRWSKLLRKNPPN